MLPSFPALKNRALFFNFYTFPVKLKYSRGFEFILNSVPYRTVPYRILPFSDTICITLAVSSREAYRFSAKKFKSANRTVFQNKDRLGVLIDLFQKREPFHDYLKTNQF
jgi:hypothetical protein